MKKKKKQFQKKLCFRCGRPGHQAKACRGNQQINVLQGSPWELTEEEKAVPEIIKGWEESSERDESTGREPWNTLSPEWGGQATVSSQKLSKIPIA